MSDETKKNKEVDDLSGVETTGHEWDGLKELNNPLPKWWLWTFYVTIVWSVGYWIAMPAWPLINGHTEGMLGYSQREVVMQKVKEGQEEQGELRTAVANASLYDLRNDRDLEEFALNLGESAFGDNCGTCHGQGGEGRPGYPNLNDDDWIWGGTLDDIYRTISYGIRSDHDETKIGNMTAFGQLGVLNSAEIRDVTAYVRHISKQDVLEEGSETFAKGATIFDQNCASCHGPEGKGSRETGSPNLTDSIWLYGGEARDIRKTIHGGRGGMMPAWTSRLDEATIKSLAFYVWTRGGGEDSEAN